MCVHGTGSSRQAPLPCTHARTDTFAKFWANYILRQNEHVHTAHRRQMARVVTVNYAVFPILADVVEVKTGCGSTAHWSILFIRLNGWLRHSFALLNTLLDIDGIGQS